jgi:hypothetical protein
MSKKLDPRLIEILKEYGEDANEALWDCHGTWVAYHKAIERIAAKAGVTFDMPQIIEANSGAKTVAIAVRGTMKDRAEWSFGEAAPANNKNAYPYAMAEKRAKDRVVLKLVGLHGLLFSEEESDDFQASTGLPTPAFTEPPRKANGLPEQGWREDGTRTSFALKNEQPDLMKDLDRELDECQTLVSFEKLKAAYRTKAGTERWNKSFMNAMKEMFDRRETAIMAEMERLEHAEPEELSKLPARTALEHSVNVLAGG